MIERAAEKDDVERTTAEKADVDEDGQPASYRPPLLPNLSTAEKAAEMADMEKAVAEKADVHRANVEMVAAKKANVERATAVARTQNEVDRPWQIDTSYLQPSLSQPLLRRPTLRRQLLRRLMSRRLLLRPPLRRPTWRGPMLKPPLRRPTWRGPLLRPPRLKTRPRLQGGHGPSFHHSRPPHQAACPSHLTSPISAAEVTIEKADVERTAAEVNRLLVKPLPGKTSVTAPPLTDVTTLTATGS